MTGGEGRAAVVAAIVVIQVGLLGYEGEGAEGDKVEEEEMDDGEKEEELEDGAELRRDTSTSLS